MIHRAPAVAVITATLAATLVGFTAPGSRARAGMTTGVAPIQSVEALALGPDGVIFVGDSKGAAVYALALEEPRPPDAAPASATPLNIADLDARIAALLGTTRRDVVMNDMVANPAAGTVYLAVTRGRGPDATPAIVRVTTGGALRLVRLDSVTFSKLEIERAATAEQLFVHPAWQRSKRRDYTVTALRYVDHELYITGVTNEEFASSLRRAAFPFNGKATTTKVSMYHTSHGMYETEAPIATFIPITLGGERVILAGYLCTPIATFPLRGLTAGGSLRGSTVIELGPGNGPRDMVTIDRGGEQYVVVATGRGWMARVKASELARARGLDKPVDDKAGVPFVTPAIRGIREIEAVSKTAFVVLQMNPDSTFSLRTVDSNVF